MNSSRFGTFGKWFTPGIGVKRWLFVLGIGIILTAFGMGFGFYRAFAQTQPAPAALNGLAALAFIGGLCLIPLALVMLSRAILAPYRRHQSGAVIDHVYTHRLRGKGAKVVAIGGGTGLPSVLKGMKHYTSNITAVVTVADDGGSSGRLRRDLGVLPPGDLRNNIAALADDEQLMTKLFQYRFNVGDLSGHAFGNLFISALAGVADGSLERALIETERVLNIQGRVFPATLENVNLAATVCVDGRTVQVQGESKITEAGGAIEELSIIPPGIEAYSGSVQAILNADLVVVGPGSLYTSILPNLLVGGITEALRATSAFKIYVCNIATQPGETENYTVADHVLALERHIGRGIFQVILANNAYPTERAGVNTRYVLPVPEHHEILQRYEVCYVDLVDPERPWRHDAGKLVNAILHLGEAERAGGPLTSKAAVPQG